MNKVLPAIFAFMLSLTIANGADIARNFSSTDEVILVQDEENVQEVVIEETGEIREKTLAEKLRDIRDAEYYNYDQKEFLLKEVFTHSFGQGITVI